MNLIKTLAALSRRRKSIHRSQKWTQRGIAAVEFALTAPVWITMLLGASDGAFWLIINEKTDRIAYSVTDVVTQYETVSISNLNDILKAATQIMLPFPFSSQGLVIVTSVYKQSGQAPTICWQYSGGGTLTKSSQIGVTGGTATLPNGLVLNNNDNVIISEVYYKFSPMFVSTGLFPSTNIYRVAIYKPRLSPLTTPPT